MSELVTVIIPVYKVEKYLSKCVDSVLSQTYKNLEVFLVDDGSPDNCGKICDEYAKKDKRVKVIHKQNGGLSSARNAALDVCTGNYITFVDSDDWIETTYVEKLYETIKKYDCDISVCFHNECDERGNVRAKKPKQFDDFYDKENVYTTFFGKKQLIDSAWGKLYKKDIFKKIRYPQGLHYEDTYLIVDVCKEVKKGIAVADEGLYNYLVMREGAITKDVSPKIFDWIVAKRHAAEVMPKTCDVYKDCCARMFYTYESIFYRIKENKDLMKTFKKLFNEDYKKYIKYTTNKTKLRFAIFKHFKFIYKLIWKC